MGRKHKDVTWDDLTLEERFVWDKCDNEHGFDRTKDGSCFDCKFMVSSLTTFAAKVVERHLASCSSKGKKS